ncbi:15377_t:CDS:2 [Entrophospora sp. SA101]|nr:15377_t:CDS:2 [Entrophospora sp. SA101]
METNSKRQQGGEEHEDVSADDNVRAGSRRSASKNRIGDKNNINGHISDNSSRRNNSITNSHVPEEVLSTIQLQVKIY